MGLEALYEAAYVALLVSEAEEEAHGAVSECEGGAAAGTRLVVSEIGGGHVRLDVRLCWSARRAEAAEGVGSRAPEGVER